MLDCILQTVYLQLNKSIKLLNCTGFFYKEDFIFKKSAKFIHTHKKIYIYIHTDINIQITYPPPVIIYRYLT